MIHEAENHVIKTGCKTISLQAQCQATGFSKQGYIIYGIINDEHGCLHV